METRSNDWFLLFLNLSVCNALLFNSATSSHIHVNKSAVYKNISWPSNSYRPVLKLGKRSTLRSSAVSSVGGKNRVPTVIMIEDAKLESNFYFNDDTQCFSTYFCQPLSTRYCYYYSWLFECYCDSKCSLFGDCCKDDSKDCSDKKIRSLTTQNPQTTQILKTLKNATHVTKADLSIGVKIERTFAEQSVMMVDKSVVSCISPNSDGISLNRVKINRYAHRMNVNGEYYWFVTKCPDDYNVATIREKCENPEQFTIEQNIPVSDSYTGFAYRNVYCALCHNISTYSNWAMNMKCLRVRTQYFQKSVALKDLWRELLTDPYCYVIFETESNLKRRCFNNTAIKPETHYSKCNETGLWEKYDHSIENKCNTQYRFASGYNTGHLVTAKNVHCLLCNGVKLTEMQTQSCGKQSI